MKTKQIKDGKEKSLYESIGPTVNDLCQKMKINQPSKKQNLQKGLKMEETNKEPTTAELKQALVNKYLFEAKERVKQESQAEIEQAVEAVIEKNMAAAKASIEAEVKQLTKEQVQECLSGKPKNIDPPTQTGNEGDTVTADATNTPGDDEEGIGNNDADELLK